MGLVYVRRLSWFVIGFLVFWMGITLSATAAEARTLRLREGFTSELDARWRSSLDDASARRTLQREVEALFQHEPVPNLPGLSYDLIALGLALEKDGRLEVAANTLELACVVANCGLRVEASRLGISMELGKYYEALGHLSSMFQKALMLEEALGSPLSRSTWMALAFVWGLALFWLLLMFRHMHNFGALLKGESEVLPTWFFGLLPLLASVVMFSFGFGVLSLLLGLTLMLPILSDRERITVLIGLIALVAVATYGSQGDVAVRQVANTSATGFFSVSKHQRARLVVGYDRTRLEGVVGTQLRFGDADGVLKTFAELRTAKSGGIDIDDDAGLVNSEGIAQAILGDTDAALSSFRRSAQLNPSRFESVYNAYSILKGMNKDAEAQAYLNKSLQLDSEAVGARIAEAFVGDIEGYVYLNSLAWYHWFTWRDVRQGGRDFAANVFEFLRSKLVVAVGSSVLFLMALLLAVFLEKRVTFHFGCPSCGKPTLQSRAEFKEAPVLCECCRLDVVTASSLARGDLHRHENRVRRWGRSRGILSQVALFGFPIFRYVLTEAPVRGWFLCTLWVVTSLGLMNALILEGDDGGALSVNVVLSVLLFVFTWVGALQRKWS